MRGDDEHLAHDGHQGVTGLEATGDQALGVGTEGRRRQANRAPGRQREHAPQTPAATFGELDLAFPLAALLDLQVQARLRYDLIDAARSGSPRPMRHAGPRRSCGQTRADF